MSEVFTIRAGDRLPIITATLKDAAGAALNLTGTTVRFRMRPLSDETFTVDAAATIDSAVGGIVSYAWAVGDTDEAGVSLAEWRVTYSGGQILTVPNDVPILVTTTPTLDSLPVISASDLALIRAYVGPETPPTDIDLALLFSELGSVEKVAERVLDGRLATMVSQPAKLTLDGDLTIDNTANIKALGSVVDRLRSGTTTGVWHGRLYRTDRER